MRLHGRAQTWVSFFGLGVGLIGAGFLTLAAAVSAKIGFHFVAICIAFAAIILWAGAVSLTLESSPSDGVERRGAGLLLCCMQFCVVLLSGSVIALVALHSINLVAAVVLEYAIVVFTSVFLVLLSWRMQGSRVSCIVLDGTAPLLRNTEDDSDQSIELQVLIRE